MPSIHRIMYDADGPSATVELYCRGCDGGGGSRQCGACAHPGTRLLATTDGSWPGSEDAVEPNASGRWVLGPFRRTTVVNALLTTPGLMRGLTVSEVVRVPPWRGSYCGAATESSLKTTDAEAARGSGLPPQHLLCPFAAAGWEFARHIQPRCGREVYTALGLDNCSDAPPYTPPQPAGPSAGWLHDDGSVVVHPRLGSDSGEGTAAAPFATLGRAIRVACSAEHRAAGKVSAQPDDS